MNEDLENTIAENAKGPAKATGDSGSMEQHPLPDQIAADRYLASKKAARGKGLGIKLVKIAGPGSERRLATDEHRCTQMIRENKTGRGPVELAGHQEVTSHSTIRN